MQISLKLSEIWTSGNSSSKKTWTTSRWTCLVLTQVKHTKLKTEIFSKLLRTAPNYLNIWSRIDRHCNSCSSSTLILNLERSTTRKWLKIWRFSTMKKHLIRLVGEVNPHTAKAAASATLEIMVHLRQSSPKTILSLIAKKFLLTHWKQSKRKWSKSIATFHASSSARRIFDKRFKISLDQIRMETCL